MSKKAATRDCIFLVRHGVAEDNHPLGDEARALTAEGRKEFRDFASELAEELDLKGIATSPLVRAVQTAELLADAGDIDDIRSEGALAADTASPASITTLARKLGTGWALVGHNPSLANTLASWIGADPDAVSFRKGAIAALRPRKDGDPPFELVFIASPGKKKKKDL